jgi:hypothetical protein
MPERSCIACRGKRAKRELIRLVGNADAVQIDPKGKDAGRGAYLCPIRECWETGLKGNRLEHTLRVKLTLENRQVLVEYGKSLPESESRG